MKYTVYFITEEYTGYTKIGYAKDVVQRISELQIGNPRVLFVAAAISCLTNQSARSMESYLHKRLSAYRIRGEWFTKDVFTANWFSENYKMPVNAKIDLSEIPTERG
jgi:hypothetical protein